MTVRSENAELRGEAKESRSNAREMQRYRRRVQEIAALVDGIERDGSLHRKHIASSSQDWCEDLIRFAVGLRTRLPEVDKGATMEGALDDIHARVKHLQYIMEKVLAAATRSTLREEEVVQLKDTVLRQARELKGLSQEARSNEDVAYELKLKISSLEKQNASLGVQLQQREEELMIERNQFEECLERLERSDKLVATLEDEIKQHETQTDSYVELEEKLDSAAIRLRTAARDKSVALEDMQDLCLALRDAEGTAAKEREKNRVLERQVAALMRVKAEHSRRSKALVGNITITKDGSVLIDKRLINK